MFHHSNTFFLPPGELDETLKQLFTNLQAQNRGMDPQRRRHLGASKT